MRSRLSTVRHLGAVAVTLALVVAAGGIARASGAPRIAPRVSSSKCAPVAASSLSLRQLANQVVAVPMQAQDVGALEPAVSAGFGGVLLFGTSAPPTMGQTFAHLRQLVPARLDPLVMTDEEGGGVLRLTNLVSPFPWARTMARTLSATQIKALARRVGTQLLAAGVNVDLAPVLDVDGRNVQPGPSDPDGYRSFGGVTSTVITDGSAFMEGLQQAGVLPVVKHFPGLGGSTGNTDDGPAATQPWATLKANDLHAFEAAILRGAPAVMVANAHVPGLTPLPGTLSAKVMTGALRTWLGFKGLVVTDTLTAGAISAAGVAPPTAAVLALEAGADLVLLGAQVTPAADLAIAQRVSNQIVAAVQHGVLARSTLEADVSYVLAAKASLHC